MRHHKGSDSIAQRYDIDPKVLAVGGYGKVFKANDKHCPGRVVAIKKCVCVDEKKVEEVKREATIMQEMDHPSICRIFELYQEGETLFLVMEYCGGGEVFTRITDSLEGKLSERNTADIIKQIALAVKYAHGRGIAHRDLKPENVCFCSSDTADMHVKVIDWGLSSQFCLQKMKSAVGSPTYTAPEVVESNGKSVYTSACDLWSLGVMTYVMLCGKPPFWGGMHQQLKMMRAEKYPIHGPDWTPISADAKDFIKRLLKADPKERMTIDFVLAHPFLQSKHAWLVESKQVRKVLDNMLLAGSTSRFFSICMTSAARQLDNDSLRSMREVFCEFDKDCDGELDLAEVQEAFEQTYGADSEMLARVEHVFGKLDLDRTNKLSYTEFCAAGMGEEICMQEEALWSAFKAFDICDDDDFISAVEIQHVLSMGDSAGSMQKDMCEQVALAVLEEYDVNHDGGIDFTEFKGMMRSCRQSGRRAYDLLVQADSLTHVENSSSDGVSSEAGSSSSLCSHTVPEESRLPKMKNSSRGRPGSVVEQKKRRSWTKSFLGMIANIKRRSTGGHHTSVQSSSALGA